MRRGIEVKVPATPDFSLSLPTSPGAAAATSPLAQPLSPLGGPTPSADPPHLTRRSTAATGSQLQPQQSSRNRHPSPSPPRPDIRDAAPAPATPGSFAYARSGSVGGGVAPYAAQTAGQVPLPSSTPTPPPTPRAGDVRDDAAMEAAKGTTLDEIILEFGSEEEKSEITAAEFFAALDHPTLEVKPVVMVNPVFDVKKLEEMLRTLEATGSQHALTLAHKRNYEKDAQGMYSALWSFPSEQRRTSGLCGCESPVLYVWNCKTALLNHQLLMPLTTKLNQLHQLNIRPVFLSLYEQTVAEIQLLRYLHGCKLFLGSDHAAMKSVLKALFDFLERASKTCSTHVVSLVQRMVLLYGSIMLSNTVTITSPRKADKPSESLIQLLDIPMPQSPAQPTAVAADVTSFIMANLVRVSGLSWGSPLVQPSPFDLVFVDWINSVIITACEGLSEAQTCALLAQGPWMMLSSLSPEQVDTHVLKPLQSLMQRALTRLHYRLSLFISEIILEVAATFPGFTMRALAAITRSAWPSKMLCAPVMPLFPWGSLGMDDLQLVLGEIYHLFTVPVQNFALQTDTAKSPHRQEFASYLLTHHKALENAYELDHSLVEFLLTRKLFSQFPHFQLFSQLAMRWVQLQGIARPHSAEFDLANFVVDELLYFAFTYTTPINHGQLLNQMKIEAQENLSNLLCQHPDLISRAIRTIGINYLEMTLPAVHGFLSQPQFASSKYVPDSNTIAWIGFFIAHTAQPSLEPLQVPIPSRTLYDTNIHTFLFSPATSRFPQGISGPCINIGCKILENVDWTKVHPTARVQVLLIILAARKFVTREWFIAFLTRKPGQRLLTGPFDFDFVSALLTIPPSQVQNPDDLIVLQVTLLISLAIYHYSAAPTTKYSAHWLTSSGLFRHMTYLVEKKDFDAVFGILPRLWDALKMEPLVCLDNLDTMLAELLSASSTHLKTMQKNMAKTLQSDVVGTRDQAIALWLLVLCRRTSTDTNYAALLDTLIHWMYCEEISFGGVKEILYPLTKQRKSIPKLLPANRPWLGVAEAMSVQPAYPSKTVGDKDIDKFKETAIGTLKEMALAAVTPLDSIPFWEQFFILYFEAQDRKIEAVPPMMKLELSKHFGSLATQVTGVERCLEDLFYAFSTWNKTTILSSKNRFSDSTLSLLRSVKPPELLKYKVSRSQESTTAPVCPTMQMLALQTAERIVSIGKLFPSKVVYPEAEIERDSVECSHIIKGIGATIQSIIRLCDHEINPQEGAEGITAFKSFGSLLSKYFALQNDLAVRDEEFLFLSSSLYINKPKPFHVTLPCSQGRMCLEPCTLHDTTVAIELLRPSIRDEIAENRQRFNRDFAAFFNVSRSISYVIEMIKSTKEWLLTGSSPLSVPGAERLFFLLLSLILEQNLPQHSPITSDIVQIAMELGRTHILLNPKMQILLHETILRTPPPKVHTAVQIKTPPARTDSNANANTLPPAPIISPIPQQAANQAPQPAPSTSPSQGRHSHSSSAPATTQASKPKFFAESSKTIYNLINPRIYLGNQEMKMLYVSQLRSLVGSRLDADDKETITSRYLIEDCFDELISDKEVAEALANVIPSMAQHKEFSEFVASYLSHLLCVSFPNNVSTVTKMLFSTATPACNELTAKAPSIFGRIDASSLELKYISILLEAFTAYLPCQFSTLESIAASTRPLFFAPVFINALEQSTSYSTDAAPSCLRLFVQAALASQETLSPSAETLKVIAELMEALIKKCPSILRNFWELCQTVILPQIPAEIDIQHFHELAKKIPAGAWGEAPSKWGCTMLDAMTASLRHGIAPAKLTIFAFSQIDWGEFARVNNILGTPGGDTRLRTSFMRLFIAVLVVSPVSVPESLRDLLSMEGKQFKWVLAPVLEFIRSLDGAFFSELMRSAFTDPSRTILDLFKALGASVQSQQGVRDIPHLASIVVEEACSATKLEVENPTSKTFWFLGVQEVASMFLEVIYPLAIFVGSSESAEAVEALPSITRAAVGFAHHSWRAYVRSSITFASSPSPAQDSPAIDDFRGKLRQIATKFAGNCTTSIALQILDSCASVLSSLPAIVGMQEEALRSYYNRTKNASPTDEAAATLRLPENRSQMAFIDACVSERAPLTLYAALNKMRKTSEPSGDEVWTGALAAKIAQLAPNQLYEFDVIAVWFAALDAVANDCFASKKEQDAFAAVILRHLQEVQGGKISSLLRNLRIGTTSPTASAVRIQLAARSCRLYLSRLQLSKAKSTGEATQKQEQEVVSMRDQLVMFRTDLDQQAREQLEPFFVTAAGFLTPLCTLDVFKHDVATTLAPMAPYLGSL